MKWYASNYDMDYDYIAVWDDGIEATREDLNMLFRHALKYKLDILWPSLLPRHHFLAKANSLSHSPMYKKLGVRKTDHCGAIAPIFETRFLKRFLSTVNDSLLEGGADV